ncbi:hypothetical protein [Bradyrhizobium sp. RDM4]|uniref:hypothetical protein n=1 Tax=Bradyrhizobium sp. RDM4 TaxID=3378765 RepID=UPI0038FD0A02
MHSDVIQQFSSTLPPGQSYDDTRHDEVIAEKGDGFRKGSTHPTDCTSSPAPRQRSLCRVAAMSVTVVGCESSFPHGKDPWVGCSESSGGQTSAFFSATCRDSLTYKNYVDCVETKVFLGEYRNRAYWFCSSLSAGNKFKVAELKRSRR